MRTRLGVGAAATCAVVVLGSGVAAAAPVVPAAPPPSTPTAPVAVLLTTDGKGVAVLRVATGALTEVRPVTGLKGDTSLVGIDVRIQNRVLYAVGNGGGIYKLTAKGAATKVRQLSVPLDGTAFGVDFNPAANALRVISNTGQNLRQTFVDTVTGTAVDGALNYVTGVITTGVAAAAYTNNDLSPDSGTTLFDLDSGLDQVVVQAPANSGSLQAVGKVGADLPQGVGFDIFTTTDPAGRSTGNAGYAVVPNQAGETTVHSVSLLTGQAPVTTTLTGGFADIAVLPLAAPAA